MELIKASDALHLLIEYQRDMFARNIVDDMEAYHRYLESHNLTDKALSEAEPEISKTIERLCTLTHPGSVRSYFQSVPDTIRLGVMLRIAYFEKMLRSYGDGFVELPSGFPECLKYGLIELWEQRQNLGPRFRKN